MLCDLDGVVWLAGTALPGAPEAVARLRESGHRVLFVTNNSSATVATQEAAMAAIGIPAVGDVVTSAAAAATLVRPGERVLVCGGPGVVEAMEQVRADMVNGATPTDVDTVVVGFHRDFDYERMHVASRAVRAGARLVATNSDATYPTPEGPIPGCGAILASVAVASGAKPVVAGKPNGPMVDAVASLLGCAVDDLAGSLVVGDRLDTDGELARALRGVFALVRTGVTAPGAEIGDGVTPAYDVADLAALVTLLAE
ncbi:MAG: HAD-IIA family hydrolase [Actinomycetota bacterium]|nr:HAD-IIA family hydrolase [Actinomycetota bacterium]MDQ3738520.1 HAD-IIA family hydrolase [Actinomycetota bacterium]